MRFLRDPKAILAVVYLLLLTGAVYNTALLPGRTILPADLLLLTPPWKQHSQELLPGFQAVGRQAIDPLFQFYPARKYLADSLHAGRTPLWNPSSFSGTPFAADDQSAIYYPPNWLFAVLPLSSAFTWVAALHTFLAGLFFMLYGRRMGWGWAAALTGATAWMLSGFMVAWQMWQVVDASLCWLPLALYFWEDRRRSLQIVGTAAALGMSALAGHLQFTCYVFMTTLAYAAFRSISTARTRAANAPGIHGNQSTRRVLFHDISVIAGAFALGIGIAAVQLFATADFLRHTIRTATTLKEIMPLMMPPAQLIQLVVPDIFGGLKDSMVHPYLGGYNYYELCVFCGSAALAFAAYAVRWSKTVDLARPRTLFWFGMAVFALLMGCGSPLYALFFYGVPLFKSFHGPARIFVLLDFAVAALAAEGVQRFLSTEVEARRKYAGRVFGVLFILLVLGYRFAVTNTNRNIDTVLTHVEPAGWLLYAMTQLGIAVCAIGAACAVIAWVPKRFSWLAVAAVAVDGLIFAVGINTSVPSTLLYPPTPETRFVSKNLGNARVWCVGDGDPNHFFQGRLVPNSAMSLGWHDVSGSDPLILKTYQPIYGALDKAQFAAPPGGPGSVAPVRSFLDRLNVRYIVSPRPISDPDLKVAYEGDVYVYENPAAFGAARLTSAGASTPVAVDVLSPGHLQLDIPPAVGAGNVDTSIVFDPGWQVYVDGKPSTASSDGLYLAAPVPAGARQVEFDYRPSSIQAGLYWTCLAWLIAISVVVVDRLRE